MTNKHGQVVNLTRARRRSFSQASFGVPCIPAMTDNVLYDMDSTTGPSSSDSDNSPENERQAALAMKSRETSLHGLNSGQVMRPALVEKNQNALTTIPMKEKSRNQTPASVPTVRTRNVSSRQVRSKEVTARKRWA